MEKMYVVVDGIKSIRKIDINVMHLLLSIKALSNEDGKVEKVGNSRLRGVRSVERHRSVWT